MTDRIAFITGANRGLGYASARGLGLAGVEVVLGARDAASGREAAAKLRSEGVVASAVVIDVTSPASVEAAAGAVEAEHGRLDILVNNAGILPEATEPGNEPLDLDLFRRTFETNVFGTVSVLEHFLPLIEKSAAGRVVNVTTTMGSQQEQLNPGSPYFGLTVPAYRASKAAVNTVTIGLSKALRDTPVKVNAVCPGWVQTDLGGPANREAAPTTADEGAQIVVEMALLPEDGPTGVFVDREGPVPW